MSSDPGGDVPRGARDTRLLRDYMNEHYAAARHQQTLRLQSLALLFSASAIIFVHGVLNLSRGFEVPETPYVIRAGAVLGFALLGVAVTAWLFNRHFDRANRYHVEVAKRARNAWRDHLRSLPGATEKSEIEDPNLIGEAVRRMVEIGPEKNEQDKVYREELAGVKFENRRSGLSIGKLLDRTLYTIPFIIGLAGLALGALSFTVRSTSG